jgi:hypothetical protein
MNIPIVNNNGNLQSFGSEFKQIYQMNLSNNLMNPQFRQTDYNTGRAVADYRSDGGLPNQNLLYTNSNNPNALTPQTQQQALDNVIDGRTTVSASEKAQNLYTRNNFDPSLRKNLILDANNQGSNMFSVESQDLVKETQTAYANYQLEDGLLQLQPGTKANIQSMKSMMQSKQTPVQAGMDLLLKQAALQQKEQTEQQAFRDRQLTKVTPTQSQRFMTKIKGAPFY